jgi:hypothetical protein
MTLVRTTPLEHRQETLKRFLVMLGVVGLAAGCDVTTPTTTSTGPYYTITAGIKDSATYAAGTSLFVPILVKYSGSAVSSAAVRWGVLSGHGHISDTLSTTDTLGATHVVWTLGATPESNALIFVAGDAVDTLHVTGVVGPPSYLDVVGARSDTTPVGVPVVLRVAVRDRLGNGASGATVNWTSSGGGLSTPATVSDATGTAMVSFTASGPGTYSVTADLPERADLFFEIVVR